MLVKAAWQYLSILSGWVLIAPPRNDALTAGIFGKMPEAALERWIQIEAFDSAKECEAGRDIAITLAVERRFLDSLQARYAKCVPVETVYPRPGKSK